MIRIAIVDDNIDMQKQLQQYIKDYSLKINTKFSVTTFINPITLLEYYNNSFDIIFMDIEMPEMDGMTAAKKIRKMDAVVNIIFVTNMAGFAIEGYKVNALSYVVKPINYLDFVQQLSRAVNRVRLLTSAYLLVASKGDMMRLDISKIVYFESREHQVIIHMLSETITIYSTLNKLEKQLENKWFSRCNNGYLVNLYYVESINKNEVHINQCNLAISRGKKKQFMTDLSDYIGGEF